MRVFGRHRPTTAHSEAVAEPAHTEAGGADYTAAADALRALVPEGHQLLSIVVER